MITSAPDAISLHEKAINEMWSRALKGQSAANCLRRLLQNDGKPLDLNDLSTLDDFRPNRKVRNKSSTALM